MLVFIIVHHLSNPPETCLLFSNFSPPYHSIDCFTVYVLLYLKQASSFRSLGRLFLVVELPQFILFPVLPVPMSEVTHSMFNSPSYLNSSVVIPSYCGLFFCFNSLIIFLTSLRIDNFFWTDRKRTSCILFLSHLSSTV